MAHLAGVVAMNGKERCASCDRAGWDVGRYDQVACIEGTEYGPCSHELCGGVCEPWGRCNCACHRETNPKEHR